MLFIWSFGIFVVSLRRFFKYITILMLFEGQVHDLKSMLPWRVTRQKKQSIRAIVEQKRRIYPHDQAKADAEVIISRLEQLPWFRDARTIMIYYPIHNEVDLRPLLKRYEGKKTFLLPVTHRWGIEPRQYLGEEMMQRGRFQIPEPQTSEYKGKIDLILVPGVAFDLKCNRIGRGAGFYDRFLRRYKRVHKIGVAYDFQIKKHELPQSFFDRPLQGVITPTQSIGL